jgi:hypothetical protein
MIARIAIQLFLVSSIEEKRKHKTLMRIPCKMDSFVWRRNHYCGATNIIPSREQKSDFTTFPEEPIHPDVSTARERSAPVSDTTYTMFD